MKRMGMRKYVIEIALAVIVLSSCSPEMSRFPNQKHPSYATLRVSIPLKSGYGRLLVYRLNLGQLLSDQRDAVFVNGQNIGHLHGNCTFVYFDGPAGEYEFGSKGAGLLITPSTPSTLSRRKINVRSGKTTFVENVKAGEFVVVAEEQEPQDVRLCRYVHPTFSTN